MASSWERLADITLGSSGDKLDSGTITAKRFLRVEIHTIATGGAIKENITFNNSRGNEYSRRRSNDSASDSTDTSQPQLEVYGDTTQDRYLGLNIINIADKEKLVIGEYVINTTGAGNAPNRSEFVGKWVNTSAQITQIEIDNTGAGSYDTGSQMTIWGTDDQGSTPFYPNLTNGTIFEESDTGKHYMFDGTDTWNEIT